MRMVSETGDWVKRHRGHLWTAFCLALVGWSAYNMGVISGRSGTLPLQEVPLIQARAGIVSQTSAPVPTGNRGVSPQHTDARVVVSKASSSKKYHFSWCPGAAKIKTENQVWFPTADAAQAAGYSLAGNCTP